MSYPAQVWLQHLLPKRLLCRVVHGAARARAPWLKDPLIRWFARHYHVDLSEAETATLTDYPTFNAFFTRALKPGARPLEGDERTIVSPADGLLTEFGRARAGQLLQAKNMRYSLAELLGEDEKEAARFVDGAYLTIYLAPHNYHRVHTPVAGTLIRTRYIPGRRLSVNAVTAGAVHGLFARNERVVCTLATAAGRLAVVLVGALNVSSISTTALGDIESGAPRVWQHEPGIPLARGAELGRFNLGSTVVLVFERGAAEWRDGLENGTEVRLGRALGRLYAEAFA
ncbi:MAG TPA: archaetidylserine decarboxylase [Gammaproteobacteria bacterium]